MGAVLSTAYAFYSCRGRFYAWVACGILLLEIAPVALFSLHPIPLGILAGIVALGGFGFLTRHRRPKKRSVKPSPDLVGVPAPMSRPATPEDLVGEWFFYLDAVASTVKMEFRPDGSYAQTLVSNRGERTPCPGGTWALDGPRVELTGYRSAVAGTIEHVWWFFGDTPTGLGLFGKDRPSLQGPFRVSRVGSEAPPPG